MLNPFTKGCTCGHVWLGSFGAEFPIELFNYSFGMDIANYKFVWIERRSYKLRLGQCQTTLGGSSQRQTTLRRGLIYAAVTFANESAGVKEMIVFGSLGLLFFIAGIGLVRTTKDEG